MFIGPGHIARVSLEHLQTHLCQSPVAPCHSTEIPPNATDQLIIFSEAVVYSQSLLYNNAL